MAKEIGRRNWHSLCSILLICVLIDIIYVCEAAPGPTFRLASYYGNHMVLQMEPHHSNIWGYGDVKAKIQLTLKEKTYSTQTYLGPEQAWIWKIILDKMPPSGPFDITIKHTDMQNITQVIVLQDVLFGDVWFCSGQSNMQFTVYEVFNATLEMLESYKYPNIRLFTADLVESNETFYDLESVLEPWSIPSPETVGKGPKIYFSAVCWFYGRNIYEHFKYPIGLIVSCWGGTPIEAWSSPDSLKMCNISDRATELSKNPKIFPEYFVGVPGPQEHSILWNAMIHPFLNLTIKGVLWYQGESNAPAPESYSCTFPAMIQDWRDKFYIGTGKLTDQQFPFGFVQISSVQGNETLINGYPTIRWHQTADYGYVPNDKMPNVFMAVAMDLGDPQSPWGPVHPRYKEDVGHRLTLAGRAVAYKEEYVTFQGPFPTEIVVIPTEDTIYIIYDHKQADIVIQYDNGFEVCCSPTNNCTYLSADWFPAPITSPIGSYGVQLSTKQCYNETMQAIRYAWRDYPCVYKQCPVYGRVDFLPAPIFLFSLGDKIVSWK